MIFHIVRFSIALAAGVGGFRCAYWAIDRLTRKVRRSTEPFALWRSLQSYISSRKAPLAFVAVLVFLLPASVPFWWRPLQIDASYYPSLRRFDPSVERLERWILENTDEDEIVLTGEKTGEWIAALTGRRVLSAPNTLPRAQARELRILLRGLFVSNDAAKMRRMVEELGTGLVVWDRSLRETYWQFDETLLESTGLFRKVHQIGDRYGIYRRR